MTSGLPSLGALIVTHGVGSLSAINGIAGAYTEHVPVICISGSIPLRYMLEARRIDDWFFHRQTARFSHPP
jgi:TPP-dependent 2-oxoacid decarboxylase